MPIAINGDGTITGVTVGGLPDGIVDADMLASNAVTSGKLASGVGGKILQVKQAVKTDTFSANHQSLVDVTGLSVSITPSSSSSKVLVTYDLNVSLGNGGYHAHVFLVRGSTKIYLGDAEGSNRTRASNFVLTTNDGVGHMHYHNVHGEFLDSPATTSATTYKLQLLGQNSSGNTMFVNRSYYDADDAGVNRTVSQITVKEVAA